MGKGTGFFHQRVEGDCNNDAMESKGLLCPEAKRRALCCAVRALTRSSAGLSVRSLTRWSRGSAAEGDGNPRPGRREDRAVGLLRCLGIVYGRSSSHSILATRNWNAGRSCTRLHTHPNQRRTHAQY